MYDLVKELASLINNYLTFFVCYSLLFLSATMGDFTPMQTGPGNQTLEDLLNRYQTLINQLNLQLNLLENKDLKVYISRSTFYSLSWVILSEAFNQVCYSLATIIFFLNTATIYECLFA